MHRALVDAHNLPKTPSELMPPFEDALDILFQVRPPLSAMRKREGWLNLNIFCSNERQDLRKDANSQGFVENEEKWVQSGLWFRVNKESQKAWTVMQCLVPFRLGVTDSRVTLLRSTPVPPTS